MECLLLGRVPEKLQATALDRKVTLLVGLATRGDLVHNAVVIDKVDRSIHLPVRKRR
jgi:hypothetical protein